MFLSWAQEVRVCVCVCVCVCGVLCMYGAYVCGMWCAFVRVVCVCVWYVCGMHLSMLCVCTKDL